MSMTLEEAIKLLKQYQGYEPMFPDGETLKHAFDLTDETVDTLLTALRPVSRDRIEKVWSGCHECSGCKLCIWNETKKCNDCKNRNSFRPLSDFCPRCGKPLTDAAVDMVMERLEALNEKD